MELLNCIVYIIVSGLVVFFIGRIIPRSWIKENSFPFKSFKFEKEGKIYEKIKIQKWKTRLPDASVVINKIVPNFMPIKRLNIKSKDKVKILIKESCVAESNHFIVAVLGLFCSVIWNKSGGRIIAVSYFLFNVPFIIIQRYNRPRLKRVVENFK